MFFSSKLKLILFLIFESKLLNQINKIATKVGLVAFFLAMYAANPAAMSGERLIVGAD